MQAACEEQKRSQGRGQTEGAGHTQACWAAAHRDKVVVERVDAGGPSAVLRLQGLDEPCSVGLARPRQAPQDDGQLARPAVPPRGQEQGRPTHSCVTRSWRRLGGLL